MPGSKTLLALAATGSGYKGERWKHLHWDFTCLFFFLMDAVGSKLGCGVGGRLEQVQRRENGVSASPRVWRKGSEAGVSGSEDWVVW